MIREPGIFRMHRLLVVCTLSWTLMSAGCGSSPRLPDDQGRQIAESFLASIRSGQLESAWNETTTEFKSLMGLESFLRFVKTHPALKNPPNFLDSRRIENQTFDLVEHRFEIAKPRPTTVTIVLAPMDSSWRVERFDAN